VDSWLTSPSSVTRPNLITNSIIGYISYQHQSQVNPAIAILKDWNGSTVPALPKFLHCPLLLILSYCPNPAVVPTLGVTSSHRQSSARSSACDDSRVSRSTRLPTVKSVGVQRALAQRTQTRWRDVWMWLDVDVTPYLLTLPVPFQYSTRVVDTVMDRTTIMVIFCDQ